MRIPFKSKWPLILTLLFSIVPAAFGNSFHLLSVPDESHQAPASGSGDSYGPIITPDGQYVLFTSVAENLCLTTNNTVPLVSIQGKLNVFLRNRTNGITSLLSVNTNGTGFGNADSIALGISTNGQFALWESSASNLVENDTNTVKDIFLRDVVNEITLLVSVSTNGGNANGASRDAVFTPDGRHVAFVSAANNLVSGDTNGIPDVFVRDLELNTTVLVSSGAIKVNILSVSEMPQISDDGRFVAFHSTATNLVPDVRTSGETYLRDLLAGTTVFVSTNALAQLNAALQATNAVSFNHIMSANGRFVAFQAMPATGNVRPAMILRHDTETGLTLLIHTNACIPNVPAVDIRNMSMTPDGRFLAFVAFGQFSSNTCVQVWDADTGTTTLASGNAEGEIPIETCDWPSIDATGRFVTFVSSAPGLVTNSLSGLYHVYLRDLLLNTTMLINATTNGTGSKVGPAGIPQVSQVGQFVAFEAFDGDFVAGDKNRACDIFLRDVVNVTTELISERSPELPSFAVAGSSTMSPWSVSWSGRYTVFVSSAENLVTNDSNGKPDIFVRDLLEGTTTLVSVNTNGVSANGTSIEPSISGDGRYVAFASTASDLAQKGANKVWNVFVRDLQSPRVALASVGGVSGSNGDSSLPRISADGKYLIFRSKATSITNTFPGTENLFLRNLENSTMTALTTHGLSDASMTRDGRFVAFYGMLLGVGPRLYIWDTRLAARIHTNGDFNGLSLAISPQGNYLTYVIGNQLNAQNWRTGSNWVVGPVNRSIRGTPNFSGDERYLTFAATNTQSVLTDSNATFDTFLFDLQIGTKTHISKGHNASEAANAASDVPVISYDGRFVAYRSAATDIVPGITNLWPNIILYDRLTGTNKLLSSGNNWSHSPVFSGDGRFLVFPSSASSLSATDFTRDIDLFGYAFLYATVTAGSSGEGPVISWPVMPGANYQVQFKDNVDEPGWQALTGEVVVVGTEASIRDDAPATAQRLYRVISF